MIRDEYVELLRRHRGSDPDWGGSAVRNAGDHIVRYLNKHKGIVTVLDFGCGAGTLKPFIEKTARAGIIVTEYDPSVEGKTRLPDGTFDLLVTTDVLEHVEPVSLDETLRWMEEHSVRQFHHIDCNDTKDRLPDGRDVHLIVAEPHWWLSKLQYSNPGWTLMEYDVFMKRKRGRYPRTSCTIILEK